MDSKQYVELEPSLSVSVESDDAQAPDHTDSNEPDKSQFLEDSVARYAKTWIQHIRDTHPNVVAKYDLQFHIASGAFGNVCAAIQRSTGKWCAIKIIDETILASTDSKRTSTRVWRMIQEIACLKQCSKSVNVVELWDFFEDVSLIRMPDGSTVNSTLRIFLVMEFCEGGTLYEYCSAKPLSEKQVHGVVTQLVNAFSFMEQNNVVHRDIKPENILVCNNDEYGLTIKVADFGMGVHFGELNLVDFIERMPLFMDKYQHVINAQWQQQWNRGTMIYDSCGSPLYMPPEMFTNKPYSFDADIWSLGILIYAMLFRKAPFSTCKNYSELNRLMSVPKINIAYPEDNTWRQRWVEQILRKMLVPSHIRCNLNAIKNALVDIVYYDESQSSSEDEDLDELEALAEEYINRTNRDSGNSSQVTIPYLEPLLHSEEFDWVYVKSTSHVSQICNMVSDETTPVNSMDFATLSKNSSLNITNDSVRSLQTSEASDGSYKVRLPINGLSDFVKSQYDIRS
uniref:Serine/threonine kinase n=1 Tax=Clandestinovirus TaxID=2831644 RepID=A0A8F8KTY0_9VIRU|nr:serine/threonine kinase [Clandestinovirus]